MNLSEKNKNGLTFIEWMCAAGFGDSQVCDITQHDVDDWRNGVDPAEFRVTSTKTDYEPPNGRFA